MKKDDIKALIALAAVFALGAVCGFYQPTYDEKVAMDTVIVHDTVPDINPTPKDSATIRYITRYLPIAKRDTSSRVAEHFREDTKMMEHLAGTSKMIAVEIPIESKHYQSKDYDAWVSGYEPSLDSIKVYRETQYITEVRTISKPPNKWELDLVGGIDYNIKQQRYTPHAGGELLYKPNRLQVGLRGGVIKNDNFEPYVGGVVKIRIH